MTRFTLGINLCFAPKRWPEPEEWARIVAEDFGLKDVQFTFDLMDPRADAGAVAAYIDHTRHAVDRHGIRIHSTFTGLIAYMGNLLLHPEPGFRKDAKDWFKAAIDVTARMGVKSTGGYIGALSMREAQDRDRRRDRLIQWISDLHDLARYAKERGLESFLVENMAVWREPPTGIEEARKLTAEKTAIPLKLTLDVGHMVVKGRSGSDLDPYAWCRELGKQAGVIHIQQSDTSYDRHQPFTPETNKTGRIEPEKVIAALKASGADEAILMFEIFHAFEEDEKKILADIRMSIEQWRKAMS